MLAESVTYPIDTAKTRLQLQGQSLVQRWSLIKYRGMSNCLVTIVKEEGVKSVYQVCGHFSIRVVVSPPFLSKLNYSPNLSINIYRVCHQPW